MTVITVETTVSKYHNLHLFLLWLEFLDEFARPGSPQKRTVNKTDKE